MSGKSVRLGILMAGLLITAGLGYRAFSAEAVIDRASGDAASQERAAAQALEAVLDLRASLHAYVAPGQDVSSWAKRAQESIGIIRDQLSALDGALAPEDGALSEALDTVGQLAASERRARGYASRNEVLLAADVIFTEARDHLASTTAQLQAARNTLSAARAAEISSRRQEQALLALAAVAAWIVVALVLLPPVKPAASNDPKIWREELAQAIKKPIPITPDAAAPLAPSAPFAPNAPSAPNALSAPQAPYAPQAPVGSGSQAPLGSMVPLNALRETSEIVSDLSTLTDLGALTGTLRRAASVLQATGVIIWVASNDGNSLAPVASHGFDEKLVSRIGRISRDSSNLTSAAFRDNVPRVSAATTTAPAALAVALCGPTGPVGVLSVELKQGLEANEQRVALATIFAAQLATLTAPLPSAPAAPVEESRTAAL
jgi:hypothetical protein